jgi:hypothetical protein
MHADLEMITFQPFASIASVFLTGFFLVSQSQYLHEQALGRVGFGENASESIGLSPGKSWFLQLSPMLDQVRCSLVRQSQND